MNLKLGFFFLKKGSWHSVGGNSTYIVQDTCHDRQPLKYHSNVLYQQVFHKVEYVKDFTKRIMSVICIPVYLSTYMCHSRRHNFPNPVCCVATICHQFRCMYCGNLGQFLRAIYNSNQYIIFCIGDMACTSSQMKLFSLYLQSGFSCISLVNLLRF